ncbi:MAG TPA: phosphatase PAP2 family protein [Ilumatobacteraceae bacterium]|nr:phosphatase PAP2 family protein [Ilumatobacteraceae bacterium]
MTAGEETRDVAVGRPAVSLLHRDPPISPATFFGSRAIWLPLVISVALTLAVLASHDGGRILETIDEPVAEWIAEQRTDTWTDVFNSVSRLGDNMVVFAIGAVLAAITWRRCRYLAIAFVVAAAFRPGLEFVLKAVIDRERPDISPLGEFAGPSHPSGHPMAAAALFGLVPAFVALHTHRAWLWWVALVASSTVVVGVAASRAYKGAHYLTDVTASLLWASLFLLVVQAIFDRFHRDRDCRHPQHETQVDAD